MPPGSILFDFDSTFIQVESIEELAKISLRGNPDQAGILSKISSLTDDAMSGRASFHELLLKRLELINATRENIEELVQVLQSKISHSILRNKEFFQEHAEKIAIVSGGFEEIIRPVIAPFKISKVFANRFLFDFEGKILGLDPNSLLLGKNAKAQIIDRLEIEEPIAFIGDGYTDLEVLESKKNIEFFAFTENVSRKEVLDKAKKKIANFDAFLELFYPHTLTSLPEKPKKVLLLEGIHPRAKVQFLKEGFHCETLETSLSEDELCEKIDDISVLGIRSKTKLSEKVLQKAKNLLAIGSFCIGTDNIDKKQCLQNGIALFNAPYSNTRSVVELALGEMILLLRKVFDRNHEMQSGQWRKKTDGASEVRGKTLGIIGYGNIGSQLSVLAENLGMRVLFYDQADKLPLGNAVKMESLQELLPACDVVSIHVSGEKDNAGLIAGQELALMKESAVLINLSRGNIVCQKALAEALRNKKLAGAGVDVYEMEPKKSNDTFENPLQGLSNTVLTPHIGGSTKEAQENIANFVSTSIVKYLKNGSSLSSVNFPRVRLPRMEHKSRIIHIHKNMAGMLAQIGNILAKEQINIEGQYLKTNNEIGYVIIDTSSPCSEDLILQLQAIPATIRVRSLD